MINMDEKSKYQEGMDINEIEIADEVANEILEKSGRDRKTYIILLMIFLVALLFLVSTITFALIGTYNRHADNVISTGSVLFSFSENSNSIAILDALPVTDEVGKTLSGNREYFEFTISVGFDDVKNNTKLNYELSLVPDSTSTLDPNYIRVYLVENTNPVLINDKEVNNLSDLEDSTIRNGAKVLYRKTVDSPVLNKYVFRMWVSQDYNVTSVEESFKCFVAVDTY